MDLSDLLLFAVFMVLEKVLSIVSIERYNVIEGFYD